MSAEGSFGISLAEKFFGLLLIAVGALITYYTFESASSLGTYTSFFGLLSIILVVIGIVLVIAKIE